MLKTLIERLSRGTGPHTSTSSLAGRPATNGHDPYATPLEVTSADDCFFYHAMELPGIGMVGEEWDLRHDVDAYLGHVDFAGRRVLEIGPASGFLTVEMEKRNAEVVAVEVPDEPGWDFVPFPTSIMALVHGPRREIMRKLKNSFWYVHRTFGSRAKLFYGDVYDLSDALGEFDIAVMGSVLLHLKHPFQAIEQCARRAQTLIITDLYYPDLEGSPICRLHPTPDNKDWGTWWHFSTDAITQFLKVMGFRDIRRSVNGGFLHHGRSYDLFTIVASDRRDEL